MVRKSFRLVYAVILFSLAVSGCRTAMTVSSLSKALPVAVSYDSLRFAGIDLTSAGVVTPGVSLPLLRKQLREKVRDIVQGNPLDGFYVRISSSSQHIAGDLLAEAMLVKPYLITCVIPVDETATEMAEVYRSSGYADLVLQAAEAMNIPGDGLPVTLKVPAAVTTTPARQVYRLDLSGMEGVSQGTGVKVNNQPFITDADGMVSFVLKGADTLSIETPSGITELPTADWCLPYIYAVEQGGTVKRTSPWVEIRMAPDDVTHASSYDFLCKAGYPSVVSINGIKTKQYKTGIFFTNIGFSEGKNRVTVKAAGPDSVVAYYEYEYTYVKPEGPAPAYPLWIDTRSSEPSADMELLQEDNLKISFRGSPGQDGFVELKPAKVKYSCTREDFKDYSLYRALIPLKALAAGKSYSLVFTLQPAAGAPVKESFSSAPGRMVTVRNPQDFPVLKVKNEYSRLTYDLGAPRLGGPIRQELGPGVLLQSTGRIGENYRIRLSNKEEGYINEADVEPMPAGTIPPSYYITSMTCGPVGNSDVLVIPWSEPVPYEVYPDPEQKRLVVTLFGVETASTWVTHRSGRKVIDRITWEQTTPETYRIFVNLTTPEIWGYDIQSTGKSLLLRVKYPPLYDLDATKPLTGLKIAIEAGHGGDNTGAIGLSGIVEKDINLDLSFRLGRLLASMGAEVVQVRDSDKYMLLLDKRAIAVNSGADMLISIHANAGGRGYLSSGGTSTYWHNPFWSPLAEMIYRHLLEIPFNEFGVVGSFNYTVTRVTQMPSVLVEQAFLSNAEDEEKLADPEIRQKEAVKIAEGIMDYLKYMKDKSAIQ